MAQNNHNTSLVLGLILAGIVSRLAPHPLNMALVTGATLYGASTLSRTSSVIIPLSIMFVTDLVLGFHSTMFLLGRFRTHCALGSYVKWQNQFCKRRVNDTSLICNFLFREQLWRFCCRQYVYTRLGWIVHLLHQRASFFPKYFTGRRRLHLSNFWDRLFEQSQYLPPQIFCESIFI
jgi:hypothetical protein